MKKSLFHIVAVLFISGTILIGCQSSAQKVENAEQNVADAQLKLDQARQDSAADYEKSKAEWNSRIAKNDQAIADYREKVVKENKIQRDKDEARLDELQKKNDVMKTNIADHEQSENSNWADFKAGFKKMTDEFDEDMKAFGESLGNVIDGK